MAAAYPVLLLARQRVDKRSICRAVDRIEGCKARPLPRMDVDELREAVQAELDDRPRAMKKRLEEFAGDVDVDRLPATVLRELLRAVRGEDVVGVEVDIDVPGAARRLYDFAKEANLVAWDELVGSPLKRPPKTEPRPARLPEDYAAACAELQALGHRDWFHHDEAGFWAEGTRYAPEDMKEVRAYRCPAKGDDGVVLRGLRAPGGGKGVVREDYGTHEVPSLRALVRRIPGAKHWDT